MSRAVAVLVALVSVLVPGAVLAAATLEQPGIESGRVGAAGLGLTAVPDVTVTVAPPDPAPTVPSSTTTTAPPPSTTRTTLRPAPAPTLPPGAPLPPLPPTTPVTGIPNVAPASSWSDGRDGVSARMRLEPAAPVAGQPVRFLLEVSSADPCCVVLLDFGDGTPGYSLHNGRSCDGPSPLTPGSHRAVATHTYAAAGAYKASLAVFSGDSCTSTIPPGGSPPPPFTGSVALTGCVSVGPGTAGQAGCSPFPAFGPDSIISPVLDPFCQVRSDCTKASPPR